MTLALPSRVNNISGPGMKGAFAIKRLSFIGLRCRPLSGRERCEQREGVACVPAGIAISVDFPLRGRCFY